MSRLTNHLRVNVVAYLALFVALGGTSYAAINLPAGSVGTKQLRNGSVTAGKLDPKTIGGSVRHWASVSASGLIIAGSRGARLTVAGAEYKITWGDQFSSRCAALVTPTGVPGIVPIADATGVGVNGAGVGKGNTSVFVWTFSHDTPTRAPFDIAIVC